MRKLLLLVMTATAILALGATSANAAIEVTDYSTGEPCPEIVVSGNTATGGTPDGGCTVWPYGAALDLINDPQSGEPFVQDHCTPHGEFLVDGDGTVISAAPVTFDWYGCYASQWSEPCGVELLEGEVVAVGGGEYAIDIDNFCYTIGLHQRVTNVFPVRFNLEPTEEPNAFYVTADQAMIYDGGSSDFDYLLDGEWGIALFGVSGS